MSRARCWSAVPLVFLGGCLPISLTESEKQTALVENNHFGAHAAPTKQTKVSYAPGSQETSLRVDAVGKKLLGENPQIGMKPHFGTMGAPQPEIFHVDNRIIYMTEGLVKQCRNDSELAAVLSLQLGKMVADREARTSPDIRSPEGMPPIQVPVGNAGQFTGQDQTAVAELARFEKNNPRGNRPLPRPDPYKLARGYLKGAGFDQKDLETVEPLIQAAEGNVALERQFKGMLPQSNWTP